MFTYAWGSYALHQACSQGDLPDVKRWLDWPCQPVVDIKDNEGRTPLMCSAHAGHISIVELLLDKGKADVEMRDQDGRTALMWAARGGRKRVVGLLLSKGALVEAEDEDGRTALHWAAEGSKAGHLKVMNLLLARGKGDYCLARDKQDMSALMYAVRAGKSGMASGLLEQRDPQLMQVQGGADEVVQCLLHAATEGQHDTVGLLLGHYAACLKSHRSKFPHVPICDIQAEALMRAATRGLDTAVTKLLATGRASLLEVEDAYGRTPLFLASQMGHLSTAKLLVNAGANINAADKAGCTPLNAAYVSNHDDIVELLIRNDMMMVYEPREVLSEQVLVDWAGAAMGAVLLLIYLLAWKARISVRR